MTSAKMEPLGGIRPGERLVQHEERRVVHERRGEPHPLTHPARVAAELPVLVLGEVDDLDRPARGARDVLDALEPRAELDELPPREEVVDGLVLGHVADPAVEIRVAGACARRTPSPFPATAG